ncbi:hypothetical protein [Sediminicoccus rosea]|uniref:Uncharacterized protein n=1 Tax=Sediminicoccus rosea TaxID=1225128 RepID=A0ABZ0PL18_9PROT|nr:hypothetical protein [Sediminicoccus rosea]WPB86394.1 hypothetical protein R9Z33_05850 [Sediminicoccus rosea]
MGDKTPNVPGHDLSQQAERDRQVRAARVARINQDLLDRPREMKRQMGAQPSLRLRIAENLWNIMEDAQSRSPAVTRATILHEAGMGRASESTKRAPYFLCDPTWPPAKKAERAKQLTHDPSGYVRLARAAAKLLGLDDRDFYLVDLFAGTRFAAEIESELPPEDPQREAWATLLALLQHQARKISQEFDLPRYFARQTGWGLGYRDGKFQPGSGGAKEPSAFLGWVEAGSPRSGVFRFRLLDPKELYGPDCTPDDVANYEDLLRRGADELPVTVHTVLVLHLVLAPQGPGSAVAPCLRARCVSYILSADYSNVFEPYTGKQMQRGDVIAVCHRAIATRAESPLTRLPESLAAGLVRSVSQQPAPKREFEIGEREMVYTHMSDCSGYGFDMGDVVLRDELHGIPPSLASVEPDDSPRIIVPLGEEALVILGLRISGFMAERNWTEAQPSKPVSAAPAILTASTVPLADEWLAQDEAGRARIAAIAANPTPFAAGTMLAALDRACQAPDHEQTPINQLRGSARELTAALATAIAEMEATRDANLRKSL